MSLMKKPTLKDFSLNNKSFEALKKKYEIIDKVVGFFYVLVSFGPGYYFGYSYILEGIPFDIKDIFAYLALAFPLSIPGIFLMGFFSKVFNTEIIAPILDKKIEKIIKFEKDTKLFFEIQEKIKRDFWFSLDGRSFEKEIGKLYQRLGYNVKIRGGANDGGIDLEIDDNKNRIAIQCKAHRRAVGPGVIREFSGSMDHAHFDQGILICPSGFTRGVYQYTGGNRIKLINVDDLVKMYDKVKPNNIR